jgi:hypothetical protein
MRKFRHLLWMMIGFAGLRAQLLPSIGINTQPANSATLCYPSYYTGSFYTSGYQVGDTVPDFKLYSMLGDSLILSDELQNGKPVLLIAGSLTCPVFRSKVPIINQVMATYGSSINVFVIYTIEAHPTNISVYSGNVNTTSQNMADGVLFPNTLTYGDRKQMIDTMPNWVGVNAPIFIDGTCNEWWNNFGPAPNNAYLIDTNGIVVIKHGWFHKLPIDNIFCDLDTYLGVNSNSCVVTTAPGQFSVSVVNSNSFGGPGSTLYDFALVVNTQSVPVTVSAQNIQQSVPTLWSTNFCADVCYGPLDTYVSFVVDPFDTLLFSLDWATDLSAPDSGRVKVGFQNVNNASNGFVYWMRASTYPPTGVVAHEKQPELAIFPNPFSNEIQVNMPDTEFELNIINALGQTVVQSTSSKRIDTNDWPPGIYTIQYRSKSSNISRKLILTR